MYVFFAELHPLLFSKDGTIICLKYMNIFSIKANSHSFSHLLLKIHMAGQDYCSGDCVTLSPPPLTIEWLGWLSGGTFERCQIIKTRRLLCKLSISCAKHILFFFVAKVKSEVRQNHHGGKDKILFSAPCTRHTFASRLHPAKNACVIACSRVLPELFLVCSALWHQCLNG